MAPGIFGGAMMLESPVLQKSIDQFGEGMNLVMLIEFELAVSRQLSFPVDDNYLCRFCPSSGWLGKLYPSLSGYLAFFFISSAI
jgi:hypothetical protein